MTFRPLPIMTALVIASLIILAMLGNWQWSRYQEKTGALDTVTPWQTLEGTRSDAAPFYLSTIVNGRSAWREVIALDVDGELVLAVAGVVFSVEAPAEPLVRPDTELGRGIFRTPSAPGLITPPPDMASRVLFAFDFPALEAELGRPVARQVFEPEQILARDETGTGVIPNPQANPALADPLPPSRHLGYALTWWGMGLALIVIYLVYHAGAGRLKFGKAP